MISRLRYLVCVACSLVYSVAESTSPAPDFPYNVLGRTALLVGTEMRA